MTLPHHPERAESGAAIAEFALIVPVLMALLLGIAEFGRLLWTKSLLDHAVDEAARCASVNAATCGSSGATASYAALRSAPLAVTAAIFTAVTASCGSQVSANYPFSFAAAALFPFSVTVRSQACFPK
jgi:Flp pilus assembly protein TadG